MHALFLAPANRLHCAAQLHRRLHKQVSPGRTGVTWASYPLPPPNPPVSPPRNEDHSPSQALVKPPNDEPIISPTPPLLSPRLLIPGLLCSSSSNPNEFQSDNISSIISFRISLSRKSVLRWRSTAMLLLLKCCSSSSTLSSSCAYDALIINSTATIAGVHLIN